MVLHSYQSAFTAVKLEKSQKYHISGAVETEPRLGEYCTSYGYVKPKRQWYVFWLSFFKIGLCSAISFKRSRLKISADVTEHRSNVSRKITKKRITPVLVSYQKPV